MRGSLVCRKVTHATRGKAEAHRRALIRKEEAEGREARTLVTYYCWRCHGYHVGHLSDDEAEVRL